MTSHLGGAPPEARIVHHGVNLAFLALTLHDDRKHAHDLAREVLDICDRCQKTGEADEWLDATVAEAHLILGNTTEALAAYGRFVTAGNDPMEGQFDVSECSHDC
jgi:hypothetical protein